MCDPSDMIDMMNHLDEESHCKDIKGDDKRQTADPADMASIMRGLEDYDKENSLKQRVRSTPRSRERRTTCDPSDMIDMMNHLDEESHCTDVGGGDRRQTADPADMASIMRGLEDDDEAEKKKEQDSAYDNDDNEVSSMFSGRESLDTVELVQSVGKMLQDLEEQEGTPGEKKSSSVRKTCVAVTMQSPRRSSRLSSVDEEGSKCQSISRLLQPAALTTPLKDSNTPSRGLRSCLASRTKPALASNCKIVT